MKKITLKEIKDMKPKEICYHEVDDLTDEAFEYAHERHEINGCDKCGGLDHSMQLVWLSEDFEPFDDEECTEKFYEKWSECALCQDCYYEEIGKIEKPV